MNTKEQQEQINRINKLRYKTDPQFRKDMVRRTLEWQTKHPQRHWAWTTIKNHKVRGIQINFSLDELEQLAHKTTECHFCNIVLDYKKKGTKGFQRNSPSLDNKDGKSVLTITDAEIICAHCNNAKSKMGTEEFRYWLANVYRNQILEIAKNWGYKKSDITNELSHQSISSELEALRIAYRSAWQLNEMEKVKNTILSAHNGITITI